MKKFVIVIISVIVLFAFFMLNYLVWDKENLQKQRETDKIEQDWLRGQNRILSTTVEELETSVFKLQRTAEEQRARIRSMEEESRSLRQEQIINQKRLLDQKDALDLYKGFLTDDLIELTEAWFYSITGNEHEQSLSFLDSEFTFWGRKYVEEDYIEFISAIEYIGMIKEAQDEEEPFVIIEGGEPQIVEALVVANVKIKDNSKEDITELSQGINSLEIGFSYNSLSKTWLILYIDTKNIANP